MHVERYGQSARFYEEVAPFLLEREAEHCLLLGICSNLMAQPELYSDPYLAAVKRNDEVVAVATITPPFGLAISNVAEPAALTALADDLHHSGRTVPDVLGPKAVARTFAEQWQARTSLSYQLDIAERIFCLRKVNPVSGVGGHLRQATLADRDLLVEWTHAFTIEALRQDDRALAERTVDLLLQSNARRRFLWEDGQPVSLAGCGGNTPNGIRIGPVYTPPELRGRGYASACVAALSQLLLDEGRKYCFLFTDLSNPTSNHIYQMIGYEPVADVDKYRFESA